MFVFNHTIVRWARSLSLSLGLVHIYTEITSSGIWMDVLLVIIHVTGLSVTTKYRRNINQKKKQIHWESARKMNSSNLLQSISFSIQD